MTTKKKAGASKPKAKSQAGKKAKAGSRGSRTPVKASGKKAGKHPVSRRKPLSAGSRAKGSSTSKPSKKAPAETMTKARSNAPVKGAKKARGAASTTTRKSPAEGTSSGAKDSEVEVDEPPPALPVRRPDAEAARPDLVPTGLDALSTEDLWNGYHEETRSSKGKSTPELEKLRNGLIERHYPLVRYIAERLLQTLPKSIELDDLISAGLFGLMDAIRGFDASRGIKFKTYCSTRIRGSILDQLRSQDWVPRLVRLKAGKIEKALQKLTGTYGREPTHAELAKTLEMDHGELVREMQDARAKTMFSLSEKWEDGDDDGSAEKVEILEDKTAVDPVSELNRSDLMNYITRSLTQKEKFIIERYYRDGHTMREIGELLSLTESRVCQIHSNVMGRLKNLLSMKEESLLT